jgi:hypothetical protein
MADYFFLSHILVTITLDLYPSQCYLAGQLFWVFDLTNTIAVGLPQRQRNKIKFSEKLNYVRKIQKIQLNIQSNKSPLLVCI